MPDDAALRSASCVIPPAPVAILPIRGSSQVFPVRRIYCVGRNYAEHAIEMGSDPTREPPFYFAKPADAVVINGADMPYPSVTKSLHHEMELVVAIGTGGKDIPEGEALSHVYGYAAGLDMTRRDLQNTAKKTGRPWDMAKGFDLSGPIGEIVPSTTVGWRLTRRQSLSQRRSGSTDTASSRVKRRTSAASSCTPA